MSNNVISIVHELSFFWPVYAGLVALHANRSKPPCRGERRVVIYELNHHHYANTF